MPEISPEKVCFIVVKARALEVDLAEDDLAGDPGSEASREALAEEVGNATAAELETFIDELNVDEQAELVALVWIGRGDVTPADWEEAVVEARERSPGNAASYLMGMPLLADYLEEGLAAFDLSCQGLEAGHL